MGTNMKLKLVIRFKNLVVETLELEPGTYEIGRALDCDIHINHSSIHRRHGKLIASGDTWSYEDHTTQNIVEVSGAPIALSSEIDMATELYTQEEVTRDTEDVLLNFRHAKKKKITYAYIGATVLVLGALLTYIFWSGQQRHSDPNLLLSQVRGQIVEFEKIKDLEAIKDYEDLGQFKDADFRDHMGYCTGFLVAPNVVLTASHCLWGSDFLDIQTNFEIRAADEKKFLPKRILGFDPVRDYLYIEVEGMEAYGALEFAKDFKVGQVVYTLGNAHGQGIAIREGNIASETPDANDASISNIRFSAGASPGNSGGPLIDTHGRIVALVIAATGAENYNVGTPAKDLKKGFKAFVEKREPQKLSVVVRKLFNFNPYDFIRKQMLPYLPEYNEYPELAEKVNAIQLDFDVPMTFEEAPEKILTEVQTKSLKAVLDIEATLLDKHELILDWKSFASEKTPVILPSQFDLSQNNFFRLNKTYYMKLGGFLDSPTKKDFQLYVDQFDKEKKFDFQAYGMNTEIVPPATPDAPIYYLPNNTAKSKKSIEDLAQGSLYSQTWLNSKMDDPQLLSRFFKTYIGEDGILSSTYSAFIRPQSFRNFTIHEITKTSDKLLVKDGSGRDWERFHVKLFDQFHIYVYCMPLPEAVTCVSRMMPVENLYRLSLVEANFREHVLAHFLENPHFWKPQPLIDFLHLPAAGSLTSFRGIQLKKDSTAYTVSLDGFKVDLQVPLEAQSIRLQTGLFKRKDQKAEWTGFGAEWVRAGSHPEVCGIGVEPLGSQSIFILNFLRDSLKRLKLKDDIKADEIPKVFTEKLKTTGGEDLQVFGYCAPLRENPMEIGYSFVDFKKAKPYAPVYKIRK
jgi:S1-C subfamily serine protease